MSERVVVLGAGYAGARAVTALERRLDDAELVWVSKHDYHLVLHEVHRLISEPSAREHVTVPVDAIKDPETEFVEGTVVGIDPAARRVDLADGSLGYDYLLVALGSDTAFYGIPGMAERAHTLNSLDDALAIHDAVRRAADDATFADPARVVIGGAGLSGVQGAGEVATYRDDHDAPIEIVLVEALEEVLPGSDAGLQRRVAGMLEARDVGIMTDDPVIEATPDAVRFDERDPLEYDVLIWTGGITGRDATAGTDLRSDHARLNADPTFRTSDERVFAVGDAAVIDLEGGPAPPTAQAAWSAADVAAGNLARAIRGDPLEEWTYRDKGTLVSVGEAATAHDVLYLPVETFGGAPARFLKKLVAARWIASVTSWRRGLSAWEVL